MSSGGTLPTAQFQCHHHLKPKQNRTMPSGIAIRALQILEIIFGVVFWDTIDIPESRNPFPQSGRKSCGSPPDSRRIRWRRNFCQGTKKVLRFFILIDQCGVYNHWGTKHSVRLERLPNPRDMSWGTNCCYISYLKRWGWESIDQSWKLIKYYGHGVFSTARLQEKPLNPGNHKTS